MEETVNALRRKLLQPTLQNAAKIGFYQRHWEEVNPEAIQTLEQLPQLPMLSKALYRSAFMLDSGALEKSALVSHTTGTTGRMTWRHRSAEEAAVINRLFGMSKTETGHKRLALNVQYGRHGMSMPMPSSRDAYAFPISLNDETEVMQALSAMEGQYHFGGEIVRPSILIGGILHICLLTQAWADRNPDRHLPDIELIQVLGYTDPGLVSFLKGFFPQADVIENFSMAEIFGSATRYWPDRVFYLDPHVIGEVVDQHGQQLQPGEVGELVLTEVFPFVQMQPLIRYRSGDIVKLVRNDDQGFAFEWCGRQQKCHADETGKWILCFTPIADWLAEQPMAARHSHLSHLPISSTDFEAPAFSMRWSEKESYLDLNIGVVTNPRLFRSEATDFAKGLWQHLREIVLVSPEKLKVRLSLTRYEPGQDIWTCKCSLRHSVALLSEDFCEA